MVKDATGRSVDLDPHLKELAEKGFSIVNDVISVSAIKELRDAVHDAVEADWDLYKGRPGKEYFISLDLVRHGKPFWNLLENELLDALFGSYIGEHWILYSFTSTVVFANEEQYTSNIHTDTGRDSGDYPLGALATIALDDFTLTNGTTWFLPGSHRGRARPSEDEFYSEAVRFERPAGSIALFDPRIWHAGGENVSGESRYGCTPFACRSFMRQRLDYPRLFKKSGLDPAELGETARRVLGYNVQVPTSLDEFYVPADQRLYQAGQG